jgi:hypothetical protein
MLVFAFFWLQGTDSTKASVDFYLALDPKTLHLPPPINGTIDDDHNPFTASTLHTHENEYLDTICCACSTIFVQ